MTATLTSQRIVNFNAGPGVLPNEVLEEAREAMLNWADSGMGIMEHSHRAKWYIKLWDETHARIRSVMSVPDDYGIMFLGGGASSQFYQVPMNFLGGTGAVADYLETGHWAQRAIKEAEVFGKVHIASSGKDKNFTYIPKKHDWSPNAVYTHFTSNNTIYGCQFFKEPDSPAPLICDASSDICSKPIDVKKYAMIYAGAQKNVGPAGVTLIIINKEFAKRGAKNIASMTKYNVHLEAEGGMYNTPPTFPIYILGLCFKWMQAQGGLAAMAKRNTLKADTLYKHLDSSKFFTVPVVKEDRSQMNVVFRLAAGEAMEKKMVDAAEKEGFAGIKGHRYVSGLRVSLYNAIAPEQVEEFVKFLKEFERTNG